MLFTKKDKQEIQASFNAVAKDIRTGINNHQALVESVGNTFGLIDDAVNAIRVRLDALEAKKGIKASIKKNKKTNKRK